jgi:hypothetical protein
MGPALTAATAKPSVTTSEVNLMIMMGTLGSWRTAWRSTTALFISSDEPGPAPPVAIQSCGAVIAFTTSFSVISYIFQDVLET